MLKNIHRDSVLVSYNPPPKSPCRNPDSDLDFNDVFGGPPRRASLQNVRHSFGEDPFGDDPEAAPLRTRWSGLYEKPVFGEHEGAKNRGGRHPNGDFFDDIFGGSESLSSSPRRQITGSPAGSRVMSPARPLPPRSDPVGSSSLPAPFSLPSKLMKPTMDLPTFGSSPRNSLLKAKEIASNGGGMISNYSFSPLSRSSSKPDLVVIEEFKDSTHRLGSLSRQLSRSNGEDSSNLTKQLSEEPYRGMSTSEDKSKGGGGLGHGHGHFHFSIYKWASQGAPPMSMPLRSGLNGSRSRDKLINSSAASEASAELETEETQVKPELKPLRSLLFDSDSKQGTVEGDSEKELLRESKVKSSSSKKKASDVSQGKVEVAKVDNRVQEIHGKSNAKGKKVKDFVKIFNQEVKKPDVVKGNTQKKPEKKKERRDSRTMKDEGSTNTTRSYEEEINLAPENHKGTHLEEASYNVKVDEHQKQSEKKPAEERSESYRSCEPEDISAASGGIPEASEEATVEDPDEPFQVRELPDEMEEDEPLPTTGSNSEELQVNDAKIRKWCQGKEGNIRSLLSTLQYVLWPGSGWKPMPLVDIIEGNAVKRAYQRALLYLHPDKLQQRGASPEQKYIAEKVFDILQEAWTQFNSLGSVV